MTMMMDHNVQDNHLSFHIDVLECLECYCEDDDHNDDDGDGLPSLMFSRNSLMMMIFIIIIIITIVNDDFYHYHHNCRHPECVRVIRSGVNLIVGAFVQYIGNDGKGMDDSIGSR